MDKTWKATERQIARRLGGSRVGNRGAATPDVVAGWLSCEVKSRAELPHWLQAAMRQAVANSWPETLQQWFGGLGYSGDATEGQYTLNGEVGDDANAT